MAIECRRIGGAGSETIGESSVTCPDPDPPTEVHSPDPAPPPTPRPPDPTGARLRGGIERGESHGAEALCADRADAGDVSGGGADLRHGSGSHCWAVSGVQRSDNRTYVELSSGRV